MTKMRALIASCLASLFILQCNANIIPALNYSISMKDYASDYSNNLIKLIRASKESAENVLKTIEELNNTIVSDLEEIKSESIPQDLLQLLKAAKAPLLFTTKKFLQAIVRFKDIVHSGEMESSEKKLRDESNVLFAEMVIREFSDSGLTQIFDIYEQLFLIKIMSTDTLCRIPETSLRSIKILLKSVNSATVINYALMDICSVFLEKSKSLQTIKGLKQSILAVDGATKRTKARVDRLSREVYACDENGVDPSNFIHLKAFQKYLFTEDQITPGYFCDKRCSAVNDMTNPIVCYKLKSSIHYDNNIICNKTKKCSKLHCPRDQDDDDFSKYEVCINETDKRYQHYYKLNSPNFKQCSGSLNTMSSTPRGKGQLSLDRQKNDCKICDCTCLDNDYYFSLEESIVDDHMAVVGARFQLLNDNKTLGIQLRQGKILANGRIDISSATWKPIKQSLSNRVKIDWNELRTIDLAYNTVSQGRVLTGLKFAKITNEFDRDRANKYRITLSVHSTLYDPAQGQLNGDHRWDIPDGKYKDELSFGGTLPRKSSDYRRLSDKNEYVVLTTTDSFEDGAQSTIPFIDNREVTQQTPTPLSGAGFIYSNQDDNGGFIGLKLITYNVNTSGQ